MTDWVIRPATFNDIPGMVALQTHAFPPPFDPELLWKTEHLERHISLFPEGQFVAVQDQQIVGSCSNTRISEERWGAHESWERTVGGAMLETFDSVGSTLYGLDVSVHPDFRRLGMGRTFYETRKELVTTLPTIRYGTACRLPDYQRQSRDKSPYQYVSEVARGMLVDRTLTPLLRYKLNLIDVINDYMDDVESGNAAALLEWKP